MSRRPANPGGGNHANPEHPHYEGYLIDNHIILPQPEYPSELAECPTMKYPEQIQKPDELPKEPIPQEITDILSAAKLKDKRAKTITEELERRYIVIDHLLESYVKEVQRRANAIAALEYKLAHQAAYIQTEVFRLRKMNAMQQAHNFSMQCNGATPQPLYYYSANTAPTAWHWRLWPMLRLSYGCSNSMALRFDSLIVLYVELACVFVGLCYLPIWLILAMSTSMTLSMLWIATLPCGTIHALRSCFRAGCI